MKSLLLSARLLFIFSSTRLRFYPRRPEQFLVTGREYYYSTVHYNNIAVGDSPSFPRYEYINRRDVRMSASLRPCFVNKPFAILLERDGFRSDIRVSQERNNNNVDPYGLFSLSPLVRLPVNHWAMDD